MDDSRAEQTYKWTVRGLYLIAIGAELIMLWHSPIGVEVREKLATKIEEARNCGPCARRKQWMRDKSHMLFEAITIVDEAKEEEAS